MLNVRKRKTKLIAALHAFPKPLNQRKSTRKVMSKTRLLNLLDRINVETAIIRKCLENTNDSDRIKAILARCQKHIQAIHNHTEALGGALKTPPPSEATTENALGVIVHQDLEITPIITISSSEDEQTPSKQQNGVKRKLTTIVKRNKMRWSAVDEGDQKEKAVLAVIPPTNNTNVKKLSKNTKLSSSYLPCEVIKKKGVTGDTPNLIDKTGVSTKKAVLSVIPPANNQHINTCEKLDKDPKLFSSCYISCEVMKEDFMKKLRLMKKSDLSFKNENEMYYRTRSRLSR